MSNRPLRILFACARLGALARLRRPGRRRRRARPAARARGHAVDVLTTTIARPRAAPVARARPSASSTAPPSTTSRRRFATAGWGSRRRFRSRSRELHRPDVVHVFGFRDPVTTAPPRGAGSRASRTSSSRSACSSRGCARCCSSVRSTQRCTAAWRAALPRSSSRREREARRRRRVRCGPARRCTCAATAFPSRTGAASNGDSARAARASPQRAARSSTSAGSRRAKGIEHLLEAAARDPGGTRRRGRA